MHVASGLPHAVVLRIGRKHSSGGRFTRIFSVRFFHQALHCPPGPGVCDIDFPRKNHQSGTRKEFRLRATRHCQGWYAPHLAMTLDNDHADKKPRRQKNIKRTTYITRARWRACVCSTSEHAWVCLRLLQRKSSRWRGFGANAFGHT